YRVELLERGGVAENVRRWGHVTLFSPFRMNRSPLGLAALAAQDPDYQPPPDDALLTGQEFATRYLVPLTGTDLLADCLRPQTQVLGVGRGGYLKGEGLGDPRRATQPFRVLVRREKEGPRGGTGEEIVTADVVVDATGTYGHPCWVGQGGLPAIGEADAAARIAYDLPDILGRQRDQYAGRHTLLVGAGYSAATSALALAELARQVPKTRVTWVTRDGSSPDRSGPLPVLGGDVLSERERVSRAANQLAQANRPEFRYLPGRAVVALTGREGDDGLSVQLAGEEGPQTVEVDRVLANVGYRPDTSLFAELPVQLCYATEGPMQLARRLSGGSADCLDQVAAGPESLLTSEANF
ncbi:MAG: hypothetical protein GTO03_05185, partial [Planctomycetales bacterium]|nr:hypothetical protein [Planctomycetales bacterium]